MNPLALIKALWESKDLVLAGALVVAVAMILHERDGKARCQQELAARPLVQQAEATKKTEGPVHIETTTTKKPDGEVVKKRVEDRSPVVTESETKKLEQPVATQPPQPRWIIAASVDMLEPARAPAVRIGRDFWNLELSYAYMLGGPARNRHRAEVGLRF